MHILLLLAAAVQFPWDSTHDELTFADVNERPECRAVFGSGSLHLTYAFTDKGEAHPVLIATGVPSKPLRVGQRLYAAGQATIYQNALVIRAGEATATVVVGEPIIGLVLTDRASSLRLFEAPSEVNSLRYTLLSFGDEDVTNQTAKVARALDCFLEAVE